jgi:hypothetical protein
MAAHIDDERRRREQRLHVVEQQHSLLAAAIRRAAGALSTREAFSTSASSRERLQLRCVASASQCRARVPRPKARIAMPATTSRAPPWRREGTVRDRAGEDALGVVEPTDQHERRDLEIARVRGVDAVAVRFERRPRRVERLRGPAEVARDERDLGLGDDAPRAGHGLLRTEGARRASQQAFARARSPSCAIAMPRSASAGASSRNATRLSAPRGSPAASARAAAVISESIQSLLPP